MPPSTPSAAFDFHVVARDLADQPNANASVRIDFSLCWPDARVASVQEPGTVVDGPARAIERTTDAQGQVSFRIVGGSSGGTPQVLGGPGCARVYIDGVLVMNAHAASSIWTARYPPTDPARADYDYVQIACNAEEVGLADLSIWLGAFFSQSAVYGVPPCGP